jgi:hypothetical protein
MRPEDKILFLCARQDIRGEHSEEIGRLNAQESIDWCSLLQTAEQHGVAPLVFINLVQCLGPALHMPAELTKRNKLYLLSQVIEKEKRAKRLAAGVEFLQGQGLEVMLLKGAALDLLVYKQPWYTISRDTDIVIRCERSSIGDEEARQIGYFFYQTGVEYDYYSHHDVNMNGVLEVDFSRVWTDARKIPFRGQTVYVMAPEDSLISLCINSCRKRFFKLKSNCDIAETVSRSPEMDWECFLEKTTAYRCETIVYAALRVAQRTVGCSLPAGLLERLAAGAYRKALIDRVIGFMLRYLPLTPYPFKGLPIFGRELHLSLLLPYVTYENAQVRRKMIEIDAGRRGQASI